MEMLFMVGVVTLIGLAITLLGFGALNHGDETAGGKETQNEPKAAVSSGNFFAEAGGTAAQPVSGLSLMSQIEGHARREREAARLFLESPSPALLWSGTKAPFAQ